MRKASGPDMLEYTSLMSSSPDDDAYDGIEPKEGDQRHLPRYSLLLTVLVALLATCAAAAFHLSVLSDSPTLLTPKEIQSKLRMAQPFANLEVGRNTMIRRKLKFPKKIFPTYITRVNAASPDTVYDSGPSVVLSPTVSPNHLPPLDNQVFFGKDSMIYHWRIRSEWQICYIAGWVSPSKDLVAGHKSYISEGDVTSIQIWNVFAPEDRTALKALSWNARPVRESLLGTVNFTSIDTQGRLEGQQLRAPTPRFKCFGDTEITVEVVSSDPALGFELIQLG
ncbi:hypothetical protein C8R45DRAFT_1103199 [Mycena sanguinolenta]|nr:hypothetical protein C8R45DRAFT_1103199 [Mycena sanguinolenta]